MSHQPEPALRASTAAGAGPGHSREPLCLCSHWHAFKTAHRAAIRTEALSLGLRTDKLQETSPSDSTSWFS